MKQVKSKFSDKTNSLGYFGRADEFFNAMKEVSVLEGRKHAACLLGIHASIALTDSITVYVLQERCTGESHLEAASLLKQACEKERADNHGVRQLEKVLSEKNRIAYGEEFPAADKDRLDNIIIRVERYFRWAFGTLKDWNIFVKQER